MKRPVQVLSIIAAAWLAAPAAMAGTDIIKCVDTQGRVTLTDQPCDNGAKATRVVQGGPDGADNVAQAPAPAPQRHVLPAAELRQSSWQRPVIERAAPLSRDVATLKAARRALLLMEAAPRGASLAGLQ